MLTLDKVLSRCIQDGDCLVWQGALNTDGYPRAGIDGNSNIKLHRWVCEHFHDIDGLVVRHTCDNRMCLKPSHLVPGTVADNVKDMDDRERRYRVVTEDVAKDILHFIKAGYRNKEISELLNIDARRVSEMRTGHRSSNGKIAKP